MKRLFKWLLFLLLALAIGVAALLFNPTLIKTPLENYLSNFVGYPVSLEGTLEIDVGSQLEITAANISLSAPDWSSERLLISIAYLNLVIETGSLFKDIVVLDSVQVDGLHVNLETNVDGVGNWAIKRPPKEKTTKKKAGARVVFKTIHLSNANFGYFNGEAGFKHHLQLTSLEQQQRENGMLHIDLIGDYNDKPLVINGSLGRFEDLLAMSNLSYNFSGNFGTLKMQSSGLIGDLMQPRRPRFDLLVEGPDIDEVTAALGLDDLGSGPFSLLAKGEEVDDHYEASIYGDIDNVSLNVSAQLSDLSKMEELDLSLAFNGPSLGAFTRAFGIKKWPDKPFRLKAKVSRVGDTLNVPDLTLLVGGTELVLDALLSNFPHFDASRVKLTIAGDDIVQFRQLLGIPGVASGPFKIQGKMDVSADSVELVELEINSSLGHAILSGTLAADPKYIGSKLHLHLDGDNAYAVMSALNVEALPEQPFSMDVRVEVVEHGLLIERGVLVTIEDERLELGGRLSFLPGSVGTDLDVKLYGMHLNRILRRLVGDTEVPDQAYGLTGRISFREDGIQLDKVKAAFAGIELETGGLLIKGDQPLSSGLDFYLNGNDLSALGEFKIIGDSLDMFVPGQPYRAAGRFSANSDGLRFDKVSGRIGQTDLAFSGLISSQEKLVGSSINFSIKGPDVHSLLKDQDQTELPSGPFETSGQISLSASTLTIKDLMFENENIHGAVQLDLGWPINREIDASFDVNINGDDIRHMLPKTEIFEPDLAAFRINATGRKKGDLISIKMAEADIGALNVKLHGKLGERSANENSNISFSATTTDLSSLGKIYGVRPKSKAFMVNTDFSGNAKQFLLRNIAVTVGKSSISGQVDISLKGEKPDISATLRSDYFDIRPWQGRNDANSDDVGTKSSDRLIPPTPLPLKALAAADVELSAHVAELRHNMDSLDNIIIEAVMHSGQLRVKKLAFEGPRGKVEASFSITPTTNDKAAVALDFRADDLMLNLTGQGDDELDKAPKFDIRLHADSSGGNLQELAGSTNGSLQLGSRGGELHGVDLSILDTFILDEIFSLIMPKSDVSDDLDLTCVAAVLEITDGLVKTDPAIAFTTGRITLVAKGTVDLKTEEMKLNFNATPNNALKLSASELFNPYILVGGTLASPAVGLDPGKVILHGGAAIGTAGLSILAKGLLDRVGTAMPICEDMLETVEAKQ